jgi:hypothetical protein
MVVLSWTEVAGKDLVVEVSGRQYRRRTTRFSRLSPPHDLSSLVDAPLTMALNLDYLLELWVAPIGGERELRH